MMDDEFMIMPPSALLTVPKRGHAARPGSGPKGETCGTCQHYAVKQMSKTYRKCALMRDVWTGGPGTDIRKKDPACSRWQAKL